MSQIAFYLNANRTKLLAQLYHLRHVIAVIEILVIYAVRVNIGISCYSRKRGKLDLITAEYKRQIVKYKLFGKHKAACSFRDRYKSREYAPSAGYYTDLGLFVLFAFSALCCKGSYRIYLLVLKERE